MTKRAFFMGLVAAALTLPGSGCGSSKGCEDLCAAREACPGVMPGDKSCAEQCKDQEALVKAAACEQQQDDFDACVSGLKDACTTTTFCGSKGTALYACYNKYCVKNPMVSGCAPYTGN